MESLIIKIMADWLLVAIFLLSIYSFVFLVPAKKWWYWSWRIVLTGILTYALAKLVGHFYQPEILRPFEQLGARPGAAYLKNPGFPSDHVLFATFLTVAVWFSTRKKYVAITLLVLTIIMGVGRVLALVHTPIDIIGGLTFGLVGVFCYRLLDKKVLK